jgi:hypothetical protein
MERWCATWARRAAAMTAAASPPDEGDGDGVQGDLIDVRTERHPGRRRWKPSLEQRQRRTCRRQPDPRQAGLVDGWGCSKCPRLRTLSSKWPHTPLCCTGLAGLAWAANVGPKAAPWTSPLATNRGPGFGRSI